MVLREVTVGRAIMANVVIAYFDMVFNKLCRQPLLHIWELIGPIESVKKSNGIISCVEAMKTF